MHSKQSAGQYMFRQLRSGCCCCGTMHAPHAKKKMLIVGSGMLDSATDYNAIRVHG